MSKSSGLGLFKNLDKIEDFRQPGKVIHQLSDILILSIAATVSGAESWEEIADFGRNKLDWLKQFSRFDAGVPSPDTIARVMQRIDPVQFRIFFASWMKRCHRLTRGEVVAIDGKTLRRSFDKGDHNTAIHMISAFATANGVVLGQVKTDEKSNEITAIPELLNLLNIKGCLVTLDAMGCQKKIAQAILDKKADYLFQVKGNHQSLLRAFQAEYNFKTLQDETSRTVHTDDENHDRIETRHYHVVPIENNESFASFIDEWPGIKTLCIEFTTRRGKHESAVDEITVRYFISSAQLSAARFAKASRKHWHIENKLHWVLDVAMNEDDCRIRAGHSAEIIASIRHIALNLLRGSSFKGGIRRKQRQAHIDDDYRSEVLLRAGLGEES